MHFYILEYLTFYIHNIYIYIYNNAIKKKEYTNIFQYVEYFQEQEVCGRGIEM